MICTSLQHKTYDEILEVLPSLEMAEIRLDLCPLSDEDIEELFAQTDIPLIATCRGGGIPGQARNEERGARNEGKEGGKEGRDEGRGTRNEENVGWAEAERKLTIAVEAGARFADLEIEAPSDFSRRFQKLCRESGTELIRSYHDFVGTPDDHGLQMALARCFRYGADIAKIVTTCHNAADAKRIIGLVFRNHHNISPFQFSYASFGAFFHINIDSHPSRISWNASSKSPVYQGSATSRGKPAYDIIR